MSSFVRLIAHDHLPECRLRSPAKPEHFGQGSLWTDRVTVQSDVTSAASIELASMSGAHRVCAHAVTLAVGRLT